MTRAPCPARHIGVMSSSPHSPARTRADGPLWRGRIEGLAAPGDRVVLSECNGRLGGATHLHWFGERRRRFQP